MVRILFDPAIRLQVVILGHVPPVSADRLSSFPWFLPTPFRIRGGLARKFPSVWPFHRGIHLEASTLAMRQNLTHYQRVTRFDVLAGGFHRGIQGTVRMAPGTNPVTICMLGAVRRMRTRIRLQAQPEPMRSIVGATQQEQRFD